MTVRIIVKPCGIIKDINERTDLSLMTDSQDVREIKDYLGNRKSLDDFSGFFVNVENGD